MSPRGKVILAAIGDFFFIGMFILAGQRTHGVELSFARWFTNVLPFWLGWLGVGLAAGVFRSRALATPAQAARWVALTWPPAALLGLWIRSMLLSVPIQLAFAAVVTATNWVGLTAWRTVLASWRMKAR